VCVVSVAVPTRTSKVVAGDNQNFPVFRRTKESNHLSLTFLVSMLSMAVFPMS